MDFQCFVELRELTAVLIEKKLHSITISKMCCIGECHLNLVCCRAYIVVEKPKVIEPMEPTEEAETTHSEKETENTQ